MIKRTHRLCLRVVLGLAFGMLPALADDPKPTPTPPAAPAVSPDKPENAKKADDSLPPAIPQTLQAKDEELSGNKLGMDCEAPEFSFKRLTPRTFLLFVKAKKEGNFVISVKSLSDDSIANPQIVVLIKDTIRAMPDPGRPVDVFFKSLEPIFAKGGKVRVVYRSTDGGAVCADRVAGFQIVSVIPQHQLDFDAGWIYNLEKEGRWDPSGDFGFSAVSHLTQSWTTLAGFHFASIGKIDSAADTGSAAGAVSNPFHSRAGSLVLNLGVEFSPFCSWWKNDRGIPRWSYPLFTTFGGGFTTPPGPDVTDLRPRVFLGLGVKVDDFNINGGTLDMLNTTGCVRLLYAYDKFYQWEEGSPAKLSTHSDYHRFVVEGELEIPGIGSKDFRPAVRGYVDVPLHKIPIFSDFDWCAPEATDGGPQESSPSRVSISLLAHVDVQVLGKLFAAK